MKRLLLFGMILALACLSLCAAGAEPVDFSHFREHEDVYCVDEVDSMTFVSSALSEASSFPLTDWGENSYANAYFVIADYHDGEDAFTAPMLLITVCTERPWNIHALTIPVDGRAFTFSWTPSFTDYAVTEKGYSQYIQIIFGRENGAFLEAMSAKGTSVTDPNALLDMPLEIVFHGDEDCTATMSEGTMMDYIAVVYAGYCLELDGLNRYIGDVKGTAMTVAEAGQEAAETAEAETEPETAEAPAGAAPLLLEDLVGVWALESISYRGETMPWEAFAGADGPAVTAEFTSDGMWILDGMGTVQALDLNVVDGVLFPGDDSIAARLEDGKLLLEVTDFPGTTLIFVRSDQPGREAAAALDEALLGEWVFEQVVTVSDDLPYDLPLDASMFPMIYGVPAPTLQVRKGGLALMILGGETVAFRAETWQLEDGKLVHTETFDDGKSMVWYFVREDAAATVEATAESE